MTREAFKHQDLDQLIEDLTITLMFLTSFREKDASDDTFCSWKSYNWNTLDELVKKEEIFKPSCYRTYSRHLTPKGVIKAKQTLHDIDCDWAYEAKLELFKPRKKSPAQKK